MDMITTKQNLESKVYAVLDTVFNNDSSIQEIKYFSRATFSNTQDKTYLIFRMSGTQKIVIETLLCDDDDDFILFKIIRENGEVTQYEYFALDQTSNIDHFVELFQSELNKVLL
jgi:hypothetical protein